LEFPLIILYNP